MDAACPICGGVACYRKITGYERWVEDFFPYHKEKVLIARFQSQKTKRTFSLLPYQLAPYKIYTIVSLMICIYQWSLISVEKKHRVSQVWEALPPDCLDSDMTPFLFREWLVELVQSFRRAHAVLCNVYDFKSVGSHTSLDGKLIEVHRYLVAILGSTPSEPMFVARIHQMLTVYEKETNQFFIGTPSQLRKAQE